MNQKHVVTVAMPVDEQAKPPVQEAIDMHSRDHSSKTLLLQRAAGIDMNFTEGIGPRVGVNQRALSNEALGMMTAVPTTMN